MAELKKIFLIDGKRESNCLWWLPKAICLLHMQRAEVGSHAHGTNLH